MSWVNDMDKSEPGRKEMELKLEGQTFDGYQIERHVSTGRYTEVYLARDSKGQEVIIKALNPRLQQGGNVTDEQVIWHFKNEIEILRRVRHEHIVQLIGHGENQNRAGYTFHYIAFEYLPGGNLGTYCRQQRTLTPDEVIELFDPICEVLSLLHDKGIVHCDIKPNNLLLVKTEHPPLVKLADFGVAKILRNGQADDRTRVGTPPYAAPEHHPDGESGDLAQPLDMRADVFALAMTILEVMTGSIPDFNRRQIDRIPLHPSLNEHRGRLLEILRRATAISVEQRYPSIKAFWNDFKMYRMGLATPALLQEDDEFETISQAYDRMVIQIDARESGTYGVSNYLTLPEGIKMEIISIPPGTIQMGTSEAEFSQSLEAFPAYLRDYAKDWLGWEMPQHQTHVKAFWMGKYPVTARQWRVVAQFINQWAIPLNPNPSGERLDDDQPVTMVSWEEAKEFCARLTVHTRKLCRLPSEAEWEYACRAGTTTLFNFSEPFGPRLVNCSAIDVSREDISGGFTRQGPSNVGRVGRPNEFGLHDMHGNVWEWCADAWHENYSDAPKDGTVWEEVHDALRVVRGGSWRSFAVSCRSASRSNFLCNDRFNDIGLRIAI